jgi:uncharacterized protein YkwD
VQRGEHADGRSLVLVVKSGAPLAQARLVGDHLALGSEVQGGLVIRNPTVSRRHALIRRRADNRGWEILDLSSTNGTFVNGRRADSCLPLAVGDRIMLGAVVLELQAPAAVSPPVSRLASGGRRCFQQRPVLLLALAFASSTLALLAYVKLRPRTTSTTPRVAITAVSNTSLPSPAPASLPRRSVAAGTATASRTTAEGAATAAKPWLARINFFRSLAKLKPVAENPALSRGDYDHARYLVKNFGGLIRRNDALGALMHTESPDRPWYTPEGLKAAQNSDVEQWYDSHPTASPAMTNPVNDWIRGPFHRLSILDPRLTEAGYGVYCEAGVCASALELPHSWSPASAPAEPVMFPAPGTAIPFSRMITGEWPDPLASCPNYRSPAGLPITLQLGIFVPALLTSHALAVLGAPVEHCAFDSATYTGRNPDDQKWARNVLAAYGAIVLVPRAPLRRGATYSVSVTANGQNYDWSFTVSDAKDR